MKDFDEWYEEQDDGRLFHSERRLLEKAWNAAREGMIEAPCRYGFDVHPADYPKGPENESVKENFPVQGIILIALLVIIIVTLVSVFVHALHLHF